MLQQQLRELGQLGYGLLAGWELEVGLPACPACQGRGFCGRWDLHTPPPLAATQLAVTQPAGSTHQQHI